MPEAGEKLFSFLSTYMDTSLDLHLPLCRFGSQFSAARMTPQILPPIMDLPQISCTIPSNPDSTTVTTDALKAGRQLVVLREVNRAARIIEGFDPNLLLIYYICSICLSTTCVIPVELHGKQLQFRKISQSRGGFHGMLLEQPHW